eukprot:TRINITY_DN25580_c0_g1_i2.p1 TRINITY_DN25580_c0_g1~~TRINITY_DN25580_c0_g1_i2.p1  ORF type:complete len:1125 (-),score=174.58 TRINITY_DN25580_c0_g1_i2:188-3562(-)
MNPDADEPKRGRPIQGFFLDRNDASVVQPPEVDAPAPSSWSEPQRGGRLVRDHTVAPKRQLGSITEAGQGGPWGVPTTITASGAASGGSGAGGANVNLPVAGNEQPGRKSGGGESTTPPPPPPCQAGDQASPTMFSVGEKVLYWSDTHKQWMDAFVKAVNCDTQGTLVSCDLDVKRGAQAAKIKRHSSFPAQPQQQQELKSFREPAGGITVLPGCAGGNGITGETGQEGGWQVGEKVEYWSDTFQQWIPAVVTRVRETGNTYDLDVKRGAQRRKMRAGNLDSSLDQDRQGGYPANGGDAAGAAAYIPATILPHQAAAVLNDGVNACGIPLLSQAAPAEAGGRFPSPLSGRLRAGRVSGERGGDFVNAAGGGESTEREMQGGGCASVGTVQSQADAAAGRGSTLGLTGVGNAGACASSGAFAGASPNHVGGPIAIACTGISGSSGVSTGIVSGQQRVIAAGKSQVVAGSSLPGAATPRDQGSSHHVSSEAASATAGLAPVSTAAGGAVIGTITSSTSAGGGGCSGVATQMVHGNTGNSSCVTSGLSPVIEGSAGAGSATPRGQAPLQPHAVTLESASGPPGAVVATLVPVPSAGSTPCVGTAGGAKRDHGSVGSAIIGTISSGTSASAGGCASAPSQNTGVTTGLTSVSPVEGSGVKIGTVQRPRQGTDGISLPIYSHSNSTGANGGTVSYTSSSGHQVLVAGAAGGVSPAVRGKVHGAPVASGLVQQSGPTFPSQMQSVSGGTKAGATPLANRGDSQQQGSVTYSTPVGGGTCMGQVVMTRHSFAMPQAEAQQNASRQHTSVFMGTGVECRRREAADSPSRGGQGRANIVTTSGQAQTVVAGRQRISLGTPHSGGSSAPAGPSTLEEDEVDIGMGPFDPSSPSLRSQLVSKLGLGQRTTIEEMQGFHGGLNEGVWYLDDPDRSSSSSGPKTIVLKLVRCHRIASAVLTEAENFLKFSRQYPGIVNDPTVAFPCKILYVMSNGTRKHDLICMRKVRGERMAELIATKWYGKQVDKLMQIFETLGRKLREFHHRYGNHQHGDFQPSNIFYDEETDECYFIDIGGVGVPTTDTDVEHFNKSLWLLADSYGHKLAQDGQRHFEKGFNSACGGPSAIQTVVPNGMRRIH